MATSISRFSSASTYTHNAYVEFSKDDKGGLSVTIDTKDLHLRSMTGTEEDRSNYKNLFSNQKVMEKYLTGETWDENKTKTRVDLWA